MSRKLTPVWLLLAFLLAGEARAMGLGDIRLQSALNEPLRAEIELISATPEELANLTIRVASAETFERYGIDRPGYLARMTFQIVASGRTDGNIVRVSTPDPVTEPFLTFLVEAVWSRGRLLREYTVLLDPPTFVREPATQAPAVVTAPTRTAPADSGRIERAAPAPAPEPEREAAPPPAPRRVTPPSTVQADEPSFEPAPVDEPSFEPAPVDEPVAEPDTRSSVEPQDRFAGVSSGGDYLVQRGDTLWSIASRVRPDSRVTVNQTMLAIYEANREAFANNINIMAAGYRLRLPDSDDVFRISRSEALAEVQRQHAAWSGRTGIAPEPSQPSLTLVPPDEDTLSPQTDVYEGPDDTAVAEPDADPDASRVRQIEQLLADHQDALIEISDSELAALRAELARLRGEELPIEAPVEDTTPVAEEPADEAADQVFVDEPEAVVEEDTADAAEPEEPEQRPAARVVSTRGSDDSLLDTVIGALTGIWGLIGLALVIVAGVLLWFVRRATRGGDDEDSTGTWESLDSGDLDADTKASTARLRAMARDDDDESIVVVEQRSTPELRRTTSLEAPVARMPSPKPALTDADDASLEDTFSSETAINLDQSDPVAEADFHMAYGLYDQAADLVSGALDAEPERTDLMAKLCEIYFVWGNRDAFIDAAHNLKDALAGAEDPEWDKIVIMGRQIAADDDMFSGQTQVGATKAVDLSFEAALGETGALDMDLAEDDFGAASDVIDLGGDDEAARDDDEDGLDFVFDTVNTEGTFKREMSKEEKADLEAMFDDDTAAAPTVEMRGDRTTSTPTIEEQFGSLGGTASLPSIDEGEEIELGGADETAEIDLDDLGLDLDGLEETRLAGDVDDDDSGLLGDLDDTAESRTLRVDDLEATGRNYALDENDLEATGKNYELDQLADAETREMPAFDETTGRSLLVDDDDETDAGLDTSLLDATGQTQILPEDFTVETGTRTSRALSDDDVTLLASDYGDDDGDASDDEIETLLAPLDEEDESEAGDFDFAKTEALPKDAFDPDHTGRTVGGTDMDLDLDDLTAALRISEADTVNQNRDDATVEQPRPGRRGYSSDFEDDSPTAAISPDDLSDDLMDARTMTEVGTKLDLARAYVDMGDPGGARSILEEVLDEGDESQRQQAKQLLDTLPG